MFGFHAGGEVARKPKFFPFLIPAVICVVSPPQNYKDCAPSITSRQRSEAEDHHLTSELDARRPPMSGRVALTILLHDLILSHNQIRILDGVWFILAQCILHVVLGITHSLPKLSDDGLVNLFLYCQWLAWRQFPRIYSLVGIYSSINEFLDWLLEIIG